MKNIEAVEGKSLKREVVVIAVISFMMSLAIQTVGFIPVMLMPTVIDSYIPNGQVKEVADRKSVV